VSLQGERTGRRTAGLADFFYTLANRAGAPGDFLREVRSRFFAVGVLLNETFGTVLVSGLLPVVARAVAVA
jgi:hypothetical protein